MYEELFRESGLSVNEARVYESLLEVGELSVQEISFKCGVHRLNVYDSLNKLVGKGLASEGVIKSQKYFKAAPPRRLVDLLQGKVARLTQALPELEAKFSTFVEKDEIYLYKGIEGFKNYLQDILRTRETVYFMGAKAFWLDPRLKHYVSRFNKERRKLGIKFVHIFDCEVKEKVPEILKLVGKPYKFLPKKYSSQMAIDIFGPYVVTFVGVDVGRLQDQPLQLVTKSKAFA